MMNPEFSQSIQELVKEKNLTIPQWLHMGNSEQINLAGLLSFSAKDLNSFGLFYLKEIGYLVNTGHEATQKMKYKKHLSSIAEALEMKDYDQSRIDLYYSAC